MTLNGVKAVILRYFSEFGRLPGALRKSSRSSSCLRTALTCVLKFHELLRGKLLCCCPGPARAEILPAGVKSADTRGAQVESDCLQYSLDCRQNRSEFVQSDNLLFILKLRPVVNNCLTRTSYVFPAHDNLQSTNVSSNKIETFSRVTFPWNDA